MSNEYILVHLKGANLSGRAVRIQPLSPDERDQILLLAAKEAGAEASMFDLRTLERNNGIKMMIKQISREACEDPNGAEVKWDVHNPQSLDRDYNKIFKAKDHAVLCSAWRQFHEVDQSEVDAIVGKALTVVVEG